MRLEFLCLSLLLVTLGCGGTRAGSPEPTPSLSIVLGPRASPQLLALTICPQRVRFSRNGNVVASSELTPLALSISTTNSTTLKTTRPTSDYDELALDLASSCASGRSVELQNQNGSYNSTAEVTLRFTRAAALQSSQDVELSLQPFEAPLEAVMANNQIEATLEAVSSAIQQVVYVSDLPFVAETLGVGPVERDRSNGSAAANDGTPLRIVGIEYAKGLGMSRTASGTTSSVKITLAGAYSSFQTDYGIDDLSPACSGNLEVLVDGASTILNTMVSGFSIYSYSVSLTGAQELELRGMAGSPSECHFDWANARLLK